MIVLDDATRNKGIVPRAKARSHVHRGCCAAVVILRRSSLVRKGEYRVSASTTPSCTCDYGYYYTTVDSCLFFMILSSAFSSLFAWVVYVFFSPLYCRQLAKMSRASAKKSSMPS